MTGAEAVSYLVQMPPAQPEPAPGCGVCATWVQRRAEAQAAGDYSRVSDCNVRLRQHPHTPPISH